MSSRASGREPQSEEPSLALLLARVRERDPGAASAFDLAWRPRLLRFCAGYVKQHDQAEDAVQEVLAKVLAAREPPEEPRVWLYRIARNHCLNLVRSRARRRDADRLATEHEPPADVSGALTGLVRVDQRAEIARALDELAPEEREVLLLRYAEDLPREEIARLCDLEIATVKSRLFTGLKKLRARVVELDTRKSAGQWPSSPA